MLEKYLNQDIGNPKYLFHGSPFKLDKLELRQSKDNENKANEDNAIFLTSWFLSACAYAFSRRLKLTNNHYSFSINNNGKLPVMTFEVDKLDDNLFGYVYIFEKNDNMIKDSNENTCQYRCYEGLKCNKVIKVYYKDYEKYFKRICK